MPMLPICGPCRRATLVTQSPQSGYLDEHRLGRRTAHIALHYAGFAGSRCVW